jgi:hypothetical protein
MKWFKSSGFVASPTGGDVFFETIAEIPFSATDDAINEIKKRNWLAEKLD